MLIFITVLPCAHNRQMYVIPRNGNRIYVTVLDGDNEAICL